jgi:hypothetical protein
MAPATETFDDAPLMPGQRFRDFRTGSGDRNARGRTDGGDGADRGLPDPPLGTPPRSTFCKVANLKGKKPSAAKKALRRFGCRLGTVRRRSSKKVPKGRVISQAPKAGKRVAPGPK